MWLILFEGEKCWALNIEISLETSITIFIKLYKNLRLGIAELCHVLDALRSAKCAK